MAGYDGRGSAGCPAGVVLNYSEFLKSCAGLRRAG